MALAADGLHGGGGDAGWVGQEVVEAAQVSGQFDYLLKVVVPDIRAWREVAGRLQDSDAGVEKVFTHIVLKEAKAFSGFPLK